MVARLAAGFPQTVSSGYDGIVSNCWGDVMNAVARLFAVCAGLLVAGGAGAAGQYPDHPVRVVVGFAAGGPTDVIARIVAEKLSASLGQQFYVDDRPGAGSNIASAEVAKSAPDGHTLRRGQQSLQVNMSLYAECPLRRGQRLCADRQVAYSPNVLAINPSVPANSVKELIELIKANPGKYSFAGTGIGSTPHLSGELFKQKFGVDLVHVPSPGAAPAVASTIAGHTQIVFSALPPALANIKVGKLRALAVLALERSAEIADGRPCARPVTPKEADTLTGVLAPVGTLKAIVDLLHVRSSKWWPSRMCRSTCSSSVSAGGE